MPANGNSLHVVLQPRLQALQTEQQADLARFQALETARQRVTETCLRRAGAIAELEALCQPIRAALVTLAQEVHPAPVQE